MNWWTAAWPGRLVRWSSWAAGELGRCLRLPDDMADSMERCVGPAAGASSTDGDEAFVMAAFLGVPQAG